MKIRTSTLLCVAGIGLATFICPPAMGQESDPFDPDPGTSLDDPFAQEGEGLQVDPFAEAADEVAASDPFRRHRGGERPENSDATVKQLPVIVEYLSLPSDKLDAWIREHKSGEVDALREAALAWIAEGEGEYLDAVLAISKSGQRVRSYAHQEMIYPAEWDPPSAPGGSLFPVAFETRWVGSSLEVDPVLSADGEFIDLNLSSELASYLGEGELDLKLIGGEPGPDDVAHPRFSVHSNRMSITVAKGRWAFLGQMVAEDTPGQSVVALVCADGVPMGEPVPGEAPEQFRVRYEWVEVPVSLWIEAVSEMPLQELVGGLYDHLLPHLEEGKIEVVARDSIVADGSGNRAQAKSIEEVVYPTEFVPPEFADQAPVPAAFETRNVGSESEIEAVSRASVDEGVVADLVVSAELTDLVGEAVHFRYQAGGKWETGVKMPRFFAMNYMGAFSMQPGGVVLAGVFTPHGEDGFADDQRKALLFVHFDE